MYLKPLTFLRFLAALVIVIFHFGNQTFIFHHPFLKEIFLQAPIAVSFFFFLSGFVLGVNYIPFQLSFKSYLIRRFARIYPLYLFAFLFTLFAGILLFGAIPRGLSIILQVLALHAWIPGDALAINFPGWSISVEVFFYLLFPFFARLASRIRFNSFLVLTILIWVISAAIHIVLKQYDTGTNSKFGEFILYFPPWNFNAFIFGISGALVFQRFQPNQKSPGFLSPVIFLASVTALILIIGINSPVRPYIHNGLLSPLFLVMCLSLALDTTWLSRVLGSKPLIYLGNISYAMYLLQFPVFLFFKFFLQTNDLSPLLFYVYLFVLIFVSAATYNYLEIPLQQIIRRVTEKGDIIKS